MAIENNKKTDPDFKPQEGQQGNERWDDKNLDQPARTGDEDEETSSPGARRNEERTNTSGAGTSQRRTTTTGTGGVGPLDSDFAQLPSEKRRDRSNSSGPGLG